MKHRTLRIDSLIREELGKILLKEVELPGALLTITEVKTSKDIDKAVVGVSILPSEKSEEALKILNRNSRHLQYLLMKKVNLKPMPQISFQVDYGPEKAAEVEKLLLKDKIGE